MSDKNINISDDYMDVSIEEEGEIIVVNVKMLHTDIKDMSKRRNYGAVDIKKFIEKNTDYKIIRLYYSGGKVRNYSSPSENVYKYIIKKKLVVQNIEPVVDEQKQEEIEEIKERIMKKSKKNKKND